MTRAVPTNIGLLGAVRPKAAASRAAALEKPQTDLILSGVSWGGVAVSAVLAGIGVVGLIWGESALSKVGAAILLVGTVMTEIAASRLPLHAQRRFAEGGWVKGCAVVVGFASLTAWNVVGAHFGMVAIDAAAVQDVRAPLERTAAETDAARETAEEALAAFDAESRRESEQMGIALRGAFESGYVTAAARSATANSAARSDRRVILAQDVSEARAEDRAAEVALEAAPHGRPDHELLGFALVLELLKGALVWFATASERRARSGSNPTGPKHTQLDPRTASAAERRALKTYCASTLATIRHLEAAHG